MKKKVSYKNPDRVADLKDEINRIESSIQSVQSGKAVSVSGFFTSTLLQNRDKVSDKDVFNNDFLRQQILEGLHKYVGHLKAEIESLTIPYFDKNRPFSQAEIAVIGSYRSEGRNDRDIAKLLNRNFFFGQKIRSSKTIAIEMKKQLSLLKKKIKAASLRHEADKVMGRTNEKR